MTANDQRRAHYHTQAKAKKEVEEVVFWLAKRQGIKDLAPSTVTVTWFAPDKRTRDNDSLGPFLKAAKDALVRAGVWPDDHCDWVTEDRLAVKLDRTNPRIEILIEEVTEYDRV
jgi:crossover junction endodeoxyribonuclease RusA